MFKIGVGTMEIVPAAAFARAAARMMVVVMDRARRTVIRKALSRVNSIWQVGNQQRWKIYNRGFVPHPLRPRTGRAVLGSHLYNLQLSRGAVWEKVGPCPRHCGWNGPVGGVSGRGNERRAIFRGEKERVHFCEVRGEMVERFQSALREGLEKRRRRCRTRWCWAGRHF